MSPARAMALLVAAMTMTGANVPFGKAIVEAMPVEVYLLFRFALASAVLGLLAGRETGPPLRALARGQAVGIAILGLVGSVLFTVLVLEGARRTSGAAAGIITSTLPAVIAVMGVAGGERLDAGRIIMIGLAIAGLAVMQAGQAGGGTETLVGNILVGLAVVCEATFVVVARGLAREIRPIRLSLAVSLASLGFCLPLALMALGWSGLDAVPAGIWVLAVWHAISASVLVTLLWYRATPHVGTWASGLATAAVPVSALITSALFLGERISGWQLAGAVLVIAALSFGALWQRRCPS